MTLRRILPSLAAAAFALSAASAQGTASKAQLHDDMRRLWEDHVTWTRLFIVSAVGGLDDNKLTTERLLQNQADIGKTVGAYYGSAAGDKLTTLLKTHIATAGELVLAAKTGNEVMVTDAKSRWYINADEIATFLSGANAKHWPLATMKAVMKTHLDQTLDEATHRIQGNFRADIADYDRIVTHILMMADVLSDGIAAQFPQKFMASGK